jgi:hypothetical protein
MSNIETLRRLRELETYYDQAVPHHALELARSGSLARYRARRAAVQSKFFDHFASQAQRAIQGHRAAPTHTQCNPALEALANDLRAARRQGLAWLSRNTG